MSGDKQPFYTHTRLLVAIICSLLIIGSSALLLLLHIASGPGSSTAGSRTPATTQSTHTATASATAPTDTATIDVTPTPFFSDYFIDNSQGWYVNDVVGYKRSLTTDGLLLTDTNHHPMIESLPGNHKFDDFVMTTTLILKQGDMNDSAGVYLRGDSNLDHDYRIAIFGNNTYAISKEYLDVHNTPQILYLVAPSHASLLKPRGEANTLTIIMRGPTLLLLINDKLVNAIIDEDYTRGQIALFVANGTTSSSVTALFSYVEIAPAPDQFPLIPLCTVTPTATSTESTTPTSTESVPTPTRCK